MGWKNWRPLRKWLTIELFLPTAIEQKKALQIDAVNLEFKFVVG
jgi:hypothetical protein